MLKFRLTTLIFCLFMVGCGQKSTNDDEIATMFLGSYLQKINRSNLPIILSEDLSIDFERCLLNIADTLNTLGFTKQRIENSKKTKVKLRIKAAILQAGEVPYFRYPDSWTAFRKNYPDGYYNISIPVINESRDRIIVSINYYCDERCGWGRTELFKKTTTGWILVRTLCRSWS